MALAALLWKNLERKESTKFFGEGLKRFGQLKDQEAQARIAPAIVAHLRTMVDSSIGPISFMVTWARRDQKGKELDIVLSTIDRRNHRRACVAEPVANLANRHAHQHHRRHQKADRRVSMDGLPYGATRRDTAMGESRKYAGTPRDTGVGLDAMGARFYAPDLGVWLSPDPVLLAEPGKLVGAHPSASAYSYASLSPAVYVDGNGDFAWVPFIAVVAGVVAVSQYAAAPTAADSPVFHKGTAEMVLDGVHNSVMIYGALRSPRVIGCVVDSFATGGVSAGVATLAQVARTVAASEAAGHAADTVDPSGNARKVVEIATGISIRGTRCFAPETPVWMCDGRDFSWWQSSCRGVRRACLKIDRQSDSQHARVAAIAPLFPRRSEQLPG